jgi:plasmid stabilization system protein ParE
MLRVRISRRAAAQLRSAAKWWAENRSKAPSAFNEELESAIALVRELPNAGEPVLHSGIAGVRRILLGRTQHHLYYRFDVSANVIDVLALWHTSRESEPSL